MYCERGTSYASFPLIPYCPFLQQSASRRLGNAQGCLGHQRDAFGTWYLCVGAEALAASGGP